ncbi:apolipoprotein N-acyltransferase [Catenovulum sediminis]|uniref:Apolipoprotein N-acyltransferase n=1 Tax=Catenovulum sediminis TaxID=1740262 RepID=A0ABV1RDJ5_9ALTE
MKTVNAWWLSAFLFLLGCSGTLAFAPYSQYWLVFLTLPAFLYLCYQADFKPAIRHAFFFSLGWFSVGLSWIHVSLAQFGGMPLAASVGMILLLAAYLALYFSAAIAVTRYLMCKVDKKMWFLLPTFWLIFEYLRSFVLTGFPWLSLGYSQIDGPFSVLVPYVGETGLSFLLVLCATLLVFLLAEKKLKIAIASLSSTVVVLMTMSFMTSSVSILGGDNLTSQKNAEKQVRLTLVQGNIKQENRWQPEFLWPTMLKYQDLSRPYYSESDIIIWPEAAIPAIEPSAQDYLTNLDQAAIYNQTSVISGIINYQPDSGEFYNSLIVLGQYEKTQNSALYFHGHENRYNKHHLLPIGEYVPFEQWLRQLAPIFDLPYSSFNRGEYIQPDLKASGFNIMAALCYEIVFPRQVRDNLKENTDFILTVSNDAWFGRSHGPHQHLEIARMRALELGIPVVRVTNTGITAVINEHGKITARAPQFEEAVLQYTLPVRHKMTWYRQYGDSIAWFLALINLLAVIFWVKKRTQQPKQQKQSNNCSA